MPTAERVFARTDHVTAFVRVYQSALTPLKGVKVASRIIDGAGAANDDREDAIGAASFDPVRRSADERISIPLERLEPGDHVLIVGAILGSSEVTQSVRFVVR